MTSRKHDRPRRYYDDARIAAAYDAEHAGQPITTEDVPFYLELALAAAAQGQQVLELGCGTGRVSLVLAAAGVRVMGLDSAAAMLEVARGRSTNPDNPVWLQADMADFGFSVSFGLVIIPFRSFSLLTSAERQRRCLRLCFQHLVPGGRLAFNVFNPAVLAGSARDRDNHTPFVARRSGPRQRHVFRSGLESMLRAAGFEIEALYGWFDRRPFGPASTEMVWLARRPTISPPPSSPRYAEMTAG